MQGGSRGIGERVAWRQLRSAVARTVRVGRVPMFAPILAGILAVLLLLVLSGLEIRPVIADLDRVRTASRPRLELIRTVRYADLGASLALRNALLAEDMALARAELARSVALRRQASDALAALAAGPWIGDAAAMFERVHRARDGLEARREQAELLAGGPHHVHDDTLNVAVQQTLDDYLAALQRLSDHEAGRTTALLTHTVDLAQRALALLGVAVGLAVLTLGFGFVAWRRAAQDALERRDRQIGELAAQRDALLREVHHRIKNHLQGLLSLVEGYRAQRPAVAAELEGLQGNVISLMAMHGLQAGHAATAVVVRALVARQVTLLQAGYPAARLVLAPSPGGEAAIAQDQALPLALVVGELLLNAIKHGGGGPVVVDVEEAGTEVRIRVTNPLPAGRQLRWPADPQAGTGLALASTLAAGVCRLFPGDAPAGSVAMVAAVPRGGA